MSSSKHQYWKVFADRHDMQLYDRAHGLLHGAVKDYEGGRLAVIECPVGIEFSHAGPIWKGAELVWADSAFGAWCRGSEQVSAATAAAREVAKISPVRSECELARALPHLAKWSAVMSDSPEIAVRLHCLSGSPRMLDICEPRMLLELPDCFCLAVLADTLSIFFPLERAPDAILASFQQIVSVRAIKA